MRKPRSLIVWIALLSLGGLGSGLHGEMTEQEKRDLFLRVREDIRPVPKASPAETPRPKPRPASTPTPTPRATPKPATPTPRPKPEATPRSTPDPTARPKPAPVEEEEDVIRLPDDEPTPRPPKATPTPQPTPKPKSTPPPRPTATPKPTAQIPKGKTPEGRKLDAPITIEKSGLEEDRGYEPPRPTSKGLFKRWRYLTPGTRKAIDRAKVKRGRWKYVIIHNSGTRQGNAKIFDVYHKRVRKMQNGLAYHFVIGNGTSSGDGEIEIGNRWTAQLNGGHVASDYLNDISLGICLVGDLNRDKPTKAQLEALDELITYLRGRVGKIKGKQAIVKGHKQINPKPTDCPGDRFPLDWLRRRFGS